LARPKSGQNIGHVEIRSREIYLACLHDSTDSAMNNLDSCYPRTRRFIIHDWAVKERRKKSQTWLLFEKKDGRWY